MQLTQEHEDPKYPKRISVFTVRRFGHVDGAMALGWYTTAALALLLFFVASQLNGANGEFTGKDDVRGGVVQCAIIGCSKGHYHKKPGKKLSAYTLRKVIEAKKSGMCQEVRPTQLTPCDVPGCVNVQGDLHYHMDESAARASANPLEQAIEDARQELEGAKDALEAFETALEEDQATLPPELESSLLAGEPGPLLNRYNRLPPTPAQIDIARQCCPRTHFGLHFTYPGDPRPDPRFINRIREAPPSGEEDDETDDVRVRMVAEARDGLQRISRESVLQVTPSSTACIPTGDSSSSEEEKEDSSLEILLESNSPRDECAPFPRSVHFSDESGGELEEIRYMDNPLNSKERRRLRREERLREEERLRPHAGTLLGIAPPEIDSSPIPMWTAFARVAAATSLYCFELDGKDLYDLRHPHGLPVYIDSLRQYSRVDELRAPGYAPSGVSLLHHYVTAIKPGALGTSVPPAPVEIPMSRLRLVSIMVNTEVHNPTDKLYLIEHINAFLFAVWRLILVGGTTDRVIPKTFPLAMDLDVSKTREYNVRWFMRFFFFQNDRSREKRAVADLNRDMFSHKFDAWIDDRLANELNREFLPNNAYDADGKWVDYLVPKLLDYVRRKSDLCETTLTTPLVLHTVMHCINIAQLRWSTLRTLRSNAGLKLKAFGALEPNFRLFPSTRTVPPGVQGMGTGSRRQKIFS